MKKLIFVLCLCLAGLSQAQVALVDSTITYDIDGNYASKLEYQYDSLGRQIAAIGYEWVEGVKVGKDYTQTDYDAQGRKVQETVYRWITATSEYVSDTRTNYTYYDGTSNTIVAIVHQAYVADKGRWRYVDMYQYAYENGRQILEEHSVMGEEDWVSQYKHTWEYAGSNTTLDQVDSLMESTGKLEIYSQTRNEYTAANKTSLTVILKWNATTQVTDSSKLSMYEYDASNNQILQLTKTYTNNVWTGGNKTIQAFENGKQVLKEYYKSYTNGEWVPGTKTIYAYDSKGNQIGYENYNSWSNGQWVGNQKYEKEYNASNRTTLQIDYAWDKNNFAWIYSKKSVTDYDGTSTRKTEEAKYTWNGSSWGKSGDTRTTTVYNASGKATEVINYVWGTTDWAYSKKTTTTDNGNTTTTEKYDWKNNAWSGTSYNEEEKVNGNLVRKLVKTWKDNQWVNKTLDTYTYSGSTKTEEIHATWNVTDWSYSVKHTWTYSGSNLTNENIYSWHDAVWVDSVWTENTWKNGVNVLSLTKTWDGTKWIMKSGSKSEQDFNEAGKETRNESFTCGKDSVWLGTKKLITAYDEANRDTLQNYYIGAKGVYTNSYEIRKAYDEWGNKILDKRMNWQGGEEGIWAGSGNAYFKEWAYNAQRKLTMEAQYIWSSDRFDWNGLTKNGYEYDETGLNKLYDVKYSWDYKKNVWYINNKMTEIRDEQGRIIEKSQFPYDTVTSQYLNGTREEYAYRGDEQVKDNIYKWYNDQWNRSQVAEKHYDSEAADALLRITVDGAWTDEGVLISYDSVYYFYNTDPKLRTIVFKNWNDTVLEQQQLLDGELPEYKGETPTKTADAQYTYTFIGWDRDIEVVTKDTFYTAQFSSTLNKYTIYFVNGEDTLQREQLEYGEMPEYKGETPTKADTETQYFTFLGWTPDIAEVTEEATYSAEFEAHNKVPTNMEQTEQKIELDLTQPMYNVQGQRVDETYHGIVIQNCRTFLR